MSVGGRRLLDAAGRGAEGLLRGFAGIGGRMAVFVWLSTITFLVIYLLSETVSDAEAAELEAAMQISVAGAEVSAFAVLVLVTIAWVVSPIYIKLIEVYREVRDG